MTAPSGDDAKPLVETLFDIAVGQWGWHPEQFWRCRPGDFWWTFRAKMPREALERPKQMREVYDMLKREKAKEAANG